MKQALYFIISIIIAGICTFDVFAQIDEQTITPKPIFIGTDRNDYALLITSKTDPNNHEFSNEKIKYSELANSLSNRFDFDVEVTHQSNTDNVFEKLEEYANQEYGNQDQLLIYIGGFYWKLGLVEDSIEKNDSFKNKKTTNSILPTANLFEQIDRLSIKHILIIIDPQNGNLADSLTTVFRDVRRGESCAFENFPKLRTRKFIVTGNCNTSNDQDQLGKGILFLMEFKNLIETTNQLDKVLCTSELDRWLIENKEFCSYFASFGSDEPGSEFLFIQK